MENIFYFVPFLEVSVICVFLPLIYVACVGRFLFQLVPNFISLLEIFYSSSHVPNLDSKSYYRCTTVGCGVKKRVERSSDDPSIVMTTYEGQHSHPFPMTPRGHIGTLTSPILDHGATATSSSSFSIPQPRYFLPHHIYNNVSLSMINRSSSDGNFVNSGSSSSSFPGFAYAMSQAPTSTSLTTRDHGLLQDILPSQIISDTINTQINEEDKK